MVLFPTNLASFVLIDRHCCKRTLRGRMAKFLLLCGDKTLETHCLALSQQHVKACGTFWYFELKDLKFATGCIFELGMSISVVFFWTKEGHPLNVLTQIW